MSKLTIATRGSELALWQARHVREALEAEQPGLEVELLVLKTKGDKILDVPLAKVGGKGLFVKEIEQAVLDGAADVAVHSMKDLPADLAPGLHLVDEEGGRWGIFNPGVAWIPKSGHGLLFLNYLPRIFHIEFEITPTDSNPENNRLEQVYLIWGNHLIPFWRHLPLLELFPNS